MNLNVNNSEEITCVVASLGSAKLLKTLNHLMSGFYTPSKIIICLPEEKKIEFPNYINTEIIVLSAPKGQVTQRIEAIKNVKTKLILQIDDDIEIHKNCLKILYDNLIQLGPKNIVGANLISQSNTHINLLTSHQCGTVTSYGEAITVKQCCYGNKRVSVEWLPGGCCLYFTGDSIIENYYPFEGKAYNEDIIASLLRSNKNIKHFFIPDAKCYLNDHSDDLKFLELKKYYLSKKYYLKLKKEKNLYYFHINFLKICIGVLFKNILKFIKKV